MPRAPAGCMPHARPPPCVGTACSPLSLASTPTSAAPPPLCALQATWSSSTGWLDVQISVDGPYMPLPPPVAGLLGAPGRRGSPRMALSGCSCLPVAARPCAHAWCNSRWCIPGAPACRQDVPAVSCQSTPPFAALVALVPLRACVQPRTHAPIGATPSVARGLKTHPSAPCTPCTKFLHPPFLWRISTLQKPFPCLPMPHCPPRIFSRHHRAAHSTLFPSHSTPFFPS